MAHQTKTKQNDGSIPIFIEGIEGTSRDKGSWQEVSTTENKLQIHLIHNKDCAHHFFMCQILQLHNTCTTGYHVVNNSVSVRIHICLFVFNKLKLSEAFQFLSISNWNNNRTESTSALRMWKSLVVSSGQMTQFNSVFQCLISLKKSSISVQAMTR